jgi:hypothetical protein
VSRGSKQEARRRKQEGRKEEACAYMSSTLDDRAAVAAAWAGDLAHHAEVDDAHRGVFLLGHLGGGGRREGYGVI